MPGGNYGTETYVAEKYVQFTTTAAAVKATSGKLCRVIITTAYTSAVNIYDNTSATGQPVFTSPATPAAGTIYDLMVPCATGIWCVPGTAGALTVTYT